MALFGSGVDKTASEIRRLHEARLSLDGRVTAARDELARLRGELPDVELENLLGSQDAGERAATARRRLVELQELIASAPALEKKLIGRLQTAIRDLHRERAREKHNDIAKLRKELDAHQGRTATLLEQLQSHEGVQFIPHRGLATVAPVITGSDIPFYITRSEGMQNRINGLLAEANAIDGAPVGGGALTDARSLEELLDLLAKVDPEAIPPSASAVRTWFEGALASGEEDRRHVAHDIDVALTFEMQISLSWNGDGEIDPGSQVRFRMARVSREYAERLGAHYIHEEVRD